MGLKNYQLGKKNNSLRGAQEKTCAGMASVYKLMPCLSTGEQLRFPREILLVGEENFSCLDPLPGVLN